MVNFYEINSTILLLFGILIAVLTFLVGNIVVLYYYSTLRLSVTNISLKNQSKKRQVIKKPTVHIFSKHYKNDF